MKRPEQFECQEGTNWREFILSRLNSNRVVIFLA